MTSRLLALLLALMAMAGGAHAQSALDLTGRALLSSLPSARGVSAAARTAAARASAPADIRIETTTGGQPAVDVFVRLDTPAAVSAVVAAGLTLQTVAGDVAIGRVAVADLGTVAEVEGVRSVQISRVRPGLRTPGLTPADLAAAFQSDALRNDAARTDTRVNQVYAGTGLPRAYAGTGVVVGVIDSGIDYDHPAFVPSTNPAVGTTAATSNPGLVRLLELLPPPPNGPGGQRVFTQAQIAARIVTEVDPNGHGTHVAGTATGSNAPANRAYRGVAPAAQLVAVKADRAGQAASGSFADADVIAAVRFVFDYATSVNLPAVVNLSLGGHSGPHDGTSNYERALDALVGLGRIIVAAAGNEGTQTFHAGYAATAATTYEVLFSTTINPVPAQGAAAGKPLNLYGYAPTNAVTSVRPALYATGAGGSLTLIGRAASFVTLDTTATAPTTGTIVDVATGQTVLASFTLAAMRDPNNGDTGFQLNLTTGGANLTSASNRAFGLEIKGTAPGRVDMWLGGGDNGTATFFTAPPASTQATRVPGDALQTVGEPASATRVISVGAYNTTNTYIDIDGNQQTRPFALGARADFSSAGPTRDGRTGVDISAPGNVVASAYSQDTPNLGGDRSNLLPGGLHQMQQGTSMSSPHVAGIIALMLQANPTLTLERVLQVFNETARTDANTGAVPNTLFGRGKIDALAAMQAVLATATASQSGLFNPTVAPGNGAGYRLLGAPVAGVTVATLAGLNLVQGVPAGGGLPAQYPLAGHNLFPTYAGAGSYPRPTGTDQVLQPGRGFFWYLYDRDIPATTGFGGGTSASRELTGFTLTATGTSATANVQQAFADNAGDDFQMLANPFARPLAVSGITVAGGTVQGGNVFQAYNPNGGGYVALQGAARLAVWQGVFAELVPATGPPTPGTTPGTVTVTYAYASTDTNPPPTFYGRTAGAAPGVSFGLRGTLASGTVVADSAAIVRLLPGALAGWDALDASKLTPPSADFVTLAPVIERDGAPYRLAVDSRPLDAQRIALVLRSTAAGAFRLTWAADLPDGWTATLADTQTGTLTDLLAATELPFATSTAVDGERFVLTLAPRGATAGAETPALALGLTAPAPNPATSRSALTLTLPASEHVRAVLVDALGREVAVLLDAEASGAVRLDVDAARLAPGVYTVRATGATFVLARRLTVVR